MRDLREEPGALPPTPATIPRLCGPGRVTASPMAPVAGAGQHHPGSLPGGLLRDGEAGPCHGARGSCGLSFRAWHCPAFPCPMLAALRAGDLTCPGSVPGFCSLAGLPGDLLGTSGGGTGRAAGVSSLVTMDRLGRIRSSQAGMYQLAGPVRCMMARMSRLRIMGTANARPKPNSFACTRSPPCRRAGRWPQRGQRKAAPPGRRPHPASNECHNQVTGCQRRSVRESP